MFDSERDLNLLMNVMLIYGQTSISIVNLDLNLRGYSRLLGILQTEKKVFQALK